MLGADFEFVLQQFLQQLCRDVLVLQAAHFGEELVAQDADIWLGQSGGGEDVDQLPFGGDGLADELAQALKETRMPTSTPPQQVQPLQIGPSESVDHAPPHRRIPADATGFAPLGSRVLEGPAPTSLTPFPSCVSSDLSARAHATSSAVATSGPSGHGSNPTSKRALSIEDVT